MKLPLSTTACLPVSLPVSLSIMLGLGLVEGWFEVALGFVAFVLFCFCFVSLRFGCVLVFWI